MEFLHLVLLFTEMLSYLIKFKKSDGVPYVEKPSNALLNIISPDLSC